MCNLHAQASQQRAKMKLERSTTTNKQSNRITQQDAPEHRNLELQLMRMNQ